MFCGFFSVNRKLFALSSAFGKFDLRDSQDTGVKPPKTFPFVSKITVRVFAWPSQRP
jgi:hypothetical protein